MIQKVAAFFLKIRQIGITTAASLLLIKIKKKLFYRYAQLQLRRYRKVPQPSGKLLNCQILGYAPYAIDITDTPWHHDGTTTQQSPVAWRHGCGLDCKPVAGPQNILTAPGPDIKVPWEIGRMHHLTQITDQADLVVHLEHFWDANPFMLGVQWSNPMEVGIRAINMILAVEELAPHKAFLKKFRKSLRQHKVMISWCIEASYKPNNHYLADLVGLWFISSYLFNIKINYQKLMRQWLQIEAAFLQQLGSDGFFYEQSTSYHKLDCELMALAYDRAVQTGITPSKKFYSALQSAFNALAWISKHNAPLPQIGDNDGGRITFFSNVLEKYMPQTPYGICEFKDFGLSILKTEEILVCLRQPSRSSGPTGHKHNDMLSMTLTINGDEFIIDPGSYCYTSHPGWRNKFRSWSAHSTPCAGLTDSFEQDMFQNNTQYRVATTRVSHEITTTITLCDTAFKKKSTKSSRYSIQASWEEFTRVIDYDSATQKIIIKDSGPIVMSNFILGRGIVCNQKNNTSFVAHAKQATIIISFDGAQSNIETTQHSPTYGSLKTTQKICLRTQ